MNESRSTPCPGVQLWSYRNQTLRSALTRGLYVVSGSEQIKSMRWSLLLIGYRNGDWVKATSVFTKNYVGKVFLFGFTNNKTTKSMCNCKGTCLSGRCACKKKSFKMFYKVKTIVKINKFHIKQSLQFQREIKIVCCIILGINNEI